MVDGVEAGSASPCLEDEYQSIVRTLPTRAPIFLPTEKIGLEARLAGVKKVQGIYQSRLDEIYRPRLKALKEKFAGRERCFVIGNGPSLNRTDLSALRDEVTFAVNGFFLKSRELNWTPTFYVVEDHLVAEDRREWINAFKGPTKLFPAYLGYCLDEADDTIFFNHRPRVSYPHGFDFSRDAAEITYAGCTVTYTCLQLAHYLGFKETYVIGVDADYDLPKDVEQSQSYGVGVLDMKSDDPNHFHPDYFGKGFRWHDPQVNKMLEAYEEARKVTDQTDQRIFNAGIGGRLEVFERRSFQSLFPQARTAEQMAQDAEQEDTPVAEAEEIFDAAPRLLLIDLTRVGDGTATGELKASLFKRWPESQLIQLYQPMRGRLGVCGADGNDVFLMPDDGASPPEVLLKIAEFNPQLILYRPVPRAEAMHHAAMSLIDTLQLPVVTWVMDDWPAALAKSDPEEFSTLNRDFERLLCASAARLSIGVEMSAAFNARYGVDFEPIANGVDPVDWPRPRTRPPGVFKVRYAGSLAANMTLESVRDIAAAIDALAEADVDVCFEIKTAPQWRNAVEGIASAFKSTSFNASMMAPEQYREWLSEADVVVVAYNFDPDSLDYVRYSMANKLPECLASGAVLLAYGPPQAATLKALEATGCGVRVTERGAEQLTTQLQRLIGSPFERLDLAEAAQRKAFELFNIQKVRARLYSALNNVACAEVDLSAPLSRDAGAHLDETQIVAKLLEKRRGRDHVMIDVGAHVGTSARYFDALGWTIHCFEPDPDNREKLTARFGASENVSIDPRAISDAPATGKSFYKSEQSTGISGLHAFHESHAEAGSVDVTTIEEVLRDRTIERIDFLKIDVEGFDFSVLKGVPWDQSRPDVIECEFEDAKTRRLGHTYKDVADFLRERGYAVYLSEWHPIIRYGISHDWRRVIPYPAADLPSDSWGNILAFREDPGFAALRRAFTQNVRSSKPASKRPGVAAVVAKTDAPPQASPQAPSFKAPARVRPKLPWRVLVSHVLQRDFPWAFPIVINSYRSVRAAWRYGVRATGLRSR